MVEHAKCSGALKDALISRGIFYCYIDDFYSKGSAENKQAALHREAKRILEESFSININDLMNQILTATRIKMTDAEYRQYVDKYLKTLKTTIDEEGNIRFMFKK